MKNTNKDIILHAGDYCFGSTGLRLHTLLGSCVSITLWHPTKKIGGMCHFALPKRFSRDDKKLNPRFADDCMALFRASAERKGTKLTDYQAKIFGGGNMYLRCKNNPIEEIQRQPIGEKNVAAAFELLQAEGLDIDIAHVGEFGYRRIIFDIADGSVWVKFQPLNSIGDQRALTGRS